MNQKIRGRLPGIDFPRVSGRVTIPASKSHTIRALLIAAFADGDSRLIRPLVSRDSLSCRAAVGALGARVSDDDGDWIVRGFGPQTKLARTHIDVGNSGTTLYLVAAMAALGTKGIRLDGDDQIRRRSAAPLLTALERMGASVDSNGSGCAPFTIAGPMTPSTVEVDCPVSQYLSAILMAAPLIPRNAEGDVTQINVTTLNEAPYVGITLDWLDFQNIRYDREEWKQFCVPPGQIYKPFDRVVPADWSSATFFLAAAAITGGELILDGLDVDDSQGDKAVLDMLVCMGCLWEKVPGGVRILGRPLTGVELDLNATPDALPAMAAVACFAQGETRLVNVPQARMKETDRIAVMTAELLKLGADVEELQDGMIIRGRRPSLTASSLKGAVVDGHDDHRVVMALAVAALGGHGEVVIKGAEAADVTFPGFFSLLARATTQN